MRHPYLSASDEMGFRRAMSANGTCTVIQINGARHGRSVSDVLPRTLVRSATREDIPALVRISNTSVAEDEDVGFGTPRSESLFSDARWLSAVWEEPNRVRGEEIFVAEEDEHIVGLVTIEDRGPEMELINIDVARDLQEIGRAHV